MSTCKVIIAGGRDFDDVELLERVIYAMAENEFADATIEIVSGMARGADALGYLFAHKHGIPVHEFPANWNKYGKRAGYKRNEEMAKVGDFLIAFWDGDSKGTGHMISTMHRLGKPTVVVKY